MTRNIVLATVLVVGALAALLYSQRGTLAVGLMDSALDTQLGTDLRDELPDGLHLAVCGAGGPLPDPVRSGPCLAVLAGRTLLVFDTGANSSRILQRMQLSPGDITALFLTHFHSDHIDGLGEMSLQRWVGRANTEPLPIHGPEGVQQIVRGFNLAYSMDHTYRHDHHGDTVAPLSGAGMRAAPFRAPAKEDDMMLVWQNDEGVQVRTFWVDHEPVAPALGYRIDYKNRSMVISGDTNEKTRVAEWAQGVDLLAHEALSDALVGLLHASALRVGNRVAAKVLEDIPPYHTTPVEAAKIAERAGVRHLLLHHIIPPLVVPGLRDYFLEGVAEHYDGPFTLSQDGTLVVMPAGSDEIEVRELLH